MHPRNRRSRWTWSPTRGPIVPVSCPRRPLPDPASRRPESCVCPSDVARSKLEIFGRLQVVLIEVDDLLGGGGSLEAPPAPLLGRADRAGGDPGQLPDAPLGGPAARSPHRRRPHRQSVPGSPPGNVPRPPGATGLFATDFAACLIARVAWPVAPARCRRHAAPANRVSGPPFGVCAAAPLRSLRSRLAP